MVASTLGTGKMTICVVMFVRVVSESDRDTNPRGPRPAVAVRPLSIARPSSTVITSGRLSSMKPPTLSRPSGMVLIPPGASNRKVGLIRRLTMVTGRESSLSVMCRTAVLGTSWSAAMRSPVASAMLGGFAINMLPASNMLSRLSGPSAVTVPRRESSARMILRLVGWQ